MARRLFGLVAAVAGAALATACDQAPPSAPQDVPSFKPVATTNACVFTGNPSLSNAIGAYFVSSADRKTAGDLATLMQTGYNTAPTPNYGAARARGFDLLAFVGKASRTPGAGSSAAAGKVVVQQAIQCMFDVAGNIGTSAAPGDFFGWPNDNQFDFETSLTPSVGGAFYVRGSATDTSNIVNTAYPSKLSYPIVAKDAIDGNLSGIAPPSGKNWQTTTLDANGILSNRALIYGEAATDGYDWKLIPRSTSFTPSATVALCAGLNGGEDFNDTSVVRQESVGALGFVAGNSICASNASLSMLDESTGALALLHRVGRVARAMFEPEPLSASVALSTIGGSASGAKKDVFSFLVLPKVTLTYLSTGATAPILGTLAANVKVNQLFSAVVNVKTPAGEPAGGVTVTLSAVTNNGTGTGIFQVRPGYTGTLVCNPANSTYGPFLSQPSVTTLGTVGLNGESQATNAVWSGNLCFSKTGGLSIVATSAGGSSGAAARSTKASAKINVKP